MNGWCEYVHEGFDTDGTEFFRCITHDRVEISSDAPCDGYQEVPMQVETTKVYVVSFAPFEERAGVGGFEWRFSRADAEAFYEKETSRSDADDYIFRLVEVDVPVKLTAREITDHLDGRIGEIEVDLPAIRDRIPTYLR